LHRYFSARLDTSDKPHHHPKQADRVLVIEEGRIAHDVVVNAARPRERGSAELAGLEGSILSHLSSADDRT
jgi:sulfonate transport system ATP-binding protein